MTIDPSSASNIAVIRLGSLGDFVQAMGPFKSIRSRHPDAKITLITTPPFAVLGKDSGYFDEVWSDGRPSWTSMNMVRLLSRMRSAKFDFVYDLQTSNRTSWYFQFLWPNQPGWSGVAGGCSHPHDNPNRIPMHTVDRQAEQLRIAGIETIFPTDVSWAAGDVSGLGLPDRYVVLVPGGSPHRPAKRWPTANYAALAAVVAEYGLTPVLLGAAAEQTELQAITDKVPASVNLCGKTDFPQIAAIGRGAIAAIGNDTGPMHLLAASGPPCLVLFSHESDPSRCAPRADLVQTLRRPTLEELPTEDVVQQLRDMSVLA